MKGNRDRVRYKVIKCMYYIFMNTYTALSLLLLIYNRLEHVQGLGCTHHLEAGRLVLWARQKLNKVV